MKTYLAANPVIALPTLFSSLMGLVGSAACAEKYTYWMLGLSFFMLAISIWLAVQALLFRRWLRRHSQSDAGSKP